VRPVGSIAIEFVKRIQLLGHLLRASQKFMTATSLDWREDDDNEEEDGQVFELR
jgi:hypothetical protein